MDNAVKFRLVKNVFQAIEIPNVLFEKLKIPRPSYGFEIRMFDRRRVKIIEIVNDRYHPIGVAKKAFGEIRADKSGAAGN